MKNNHINAYMIFMFPVFLLGQGVPGAGTVSPSCLVRLAAPQVRVLLRFSLWHPPTPDLWTAPVLAVRPYPAPAVAAREQEDPVAKGGPVPLEETPLRLLLFAQYDGSMAPVKRYRPCGPYRHFLTGSPRPPCPPLALPVSLMTALSFQLLRPKHSRHPRLPSFSCTYPACPHPFPALSSGDIQNPMSPPHGHGCP